MQKEDPFQNSFNHGNSDHHWWVGMREAIHLKLQKCEIFRQLFMIARKCSKKNVSKEHRE